MEKRFFKISRCLQERQTGQICTYGAFNNLKENEFGARERGIEVVLQWSKYCAILGGK